MVSEKKYGLIVKMAVLSIIIMEYTTSLVTPVLGEMAQAFASQGVSPELIKQIQSLPNLTMIIVALLVGQIERFLTKRQMLFIALGAMFIGGILPAFGGGIYFILACRALVGLGRGIVFPFAMSWIVELFEGKERDTLMGFRSTVGSIAGIIFMQVGAILAAGNWRGAFYGYLIMIPFIIFMLFKLPEPEKKAEPAPAVGTKQSKLTTNTWVLILGNMLFMFCAYSFMTNVAIVITDMKLGTAQLSANVLSSFVITSAVTGLFFGMVIRPLFKKYTIAVGMAFVGASLTFLLTAQTVGHFFIGGILFGIGFSVYNTALFLDVPASAHPSAAAMSMAMLMAFNGLGQFGSNIVLAFISNILGFTGAKAGWMIAGPAILIGTVVVILVKAFAKQKQEKPVESTH